MTVPLCYLSKYGCLILTLYPLNVVSDDIRDKLIADGIKPEEIAYVHDAKTEQQKADLFDRVNKGEVRVLLGSTSKMGTGTNCQKKLIALHNLDIPWRPSDLQQRIGRIERQGNQNSVAHVFNYVTKGSFDAYLYQTLEAKQRFIGQIMTSKTPARTCEDVDQQALNYSEIKALCTGDERIKEKMMLDNEVKELNLLKVEHTNMVFDMQQTVVVTPAKIEKAEKRLDNLKADRETLRQIPIDEETKLPVFRITIAARNTQIVKKLHRPLKMRYWILLKRVPTVKRKSVNFRDSNYPSKLLCLAMNLTFPLP